MKAVAYKESLPISDGQALLDVELPRPECGANDLLVKVEAISVNPVDTKVRVRRPPEPGQLKVLGWDVAGVVEDVGSQVSGFAVGDRVWYAGAINRQGANAEYHCVDARIASHMPSSLSFEQGAAMPLTTITAWELLFDRLAITDQSEGSLLVIGAAGGVGSILVQLARQLTGLTIVGTASRPETKAWVEQCGAHHVIDHHQPLTEQLQTIGIPQVEYVTSLTHSDENLPALVEVIAPQGKLALIDDPKTLDIVPLKYKCISVHWEYMFARSLYQTADMSKQHELLHKVAQMVDEGKIKTTLAENFGSINAANLMRAHAFIERGKSRGKVVLSGF